MFSNFSVVVDLDGTIIDSVPLVQVIVSQVRERLVEEGLEIPYMDVNRLREAMGTPGSQYLARLWSGLDAYTLEYANSLYGEMERKVPFSAYVKPYPGILSSLSKLRRIGYKLVLATNASRSYMNRCIEIVCGDDLFVSRFAEDDAPTNHIKCEVIRRLLRHMSNDRICMIGDSSSDWLASSETGVRFVFAAYGYGDQIPGRSCLRYR